MYVNDQQARFVGISEELATQGVIYLPIAEALEQQPALMEKYFLQSPPSSVRRSFRTPCRSGQSWLYPLRPTRRRDHKPFINYYWTSGERAAVFPHTLIVTEDNAKATVVDVFFSETEENEALNISVANIHAGNGANVSRKVIQDRNEKTVSFQLDTTVAGRDAQVKNLAVNIGAERRATKTRPASSGSRRENVFAHCGRRSRVRPAHLPDPQRAKRCIRSSVQERTARQQPHHLLRTDQSRRGAQQTDAYQTNRNLLLDPNADANSMPGLEILANDVKCSTAPPPATSIRKNSST